MIWDKILGVLIGLGIAGILFAEYLVELNIYNRIIIATALGSIFVNLAIFIFLLGLFISVDFIVFSVLILLMIDIWDD